MNLQAKTIMYVVALTLLASCATTNDPTPTLARLFADTASRERIISTECLDAERQHANPEYTVYLQSGSTELDERCNTLVKVINKETKGSRAQVRLMLLSKLNEYGCLFFLRELNRYYRVLNHPEFLAAAKLSGKKPSEIYAYVARSGD